MYLLVPAPASPDLISIEYRIAKLYMGKVYKGVVHLIWDYSLINLYFRDFTDKFVQNPDGALQTLAQAKLNLCHNSWKHD